MECLGIMVSRPVLKRIVKNMSSCERVLFYEQSSKKYNFQLCYFSLDDLSMEDGTVLASFKVNHGWEKKKIPIPRVIHNRMRIGRKKRILSLISNGTTIFNQQTIYGKLYISKLLEEEMNFHSHLPLTSEFSEHSIPTYMERFDSFLLKPNKQSLGNGIIMIRRFSDTLWEISYPKSTNILNELVYADELQAKMMQIVGNKKYLIQERIDLAIFRGSPFDMRVTVQKGEYGRWHVTGIFARVAKAGDFVTNAAKGGTCYKLEEIFNDLPHLNLFTVKKKVQQLALAFAYYLEKKLPYLADAGFDIGIDENGHPYFIEMNLRDLRYGFGKANMMEAWKKSFESPIAYGRFLIDSN